MPRACVALGGRLPAASRSAWGATESTELDHFLSARWGLHVHWWGRTLYVPNHHEAWPVHDAEVLELDDDLVTSAGLPGLTSRPPDHVAFSPGVRTVFGFPGDATRPRSALTFSSVRSGA